MDKALNNEILPLNAIELEPNRNTISPSQPIPNSNLPEDSKQISTALYSTPTKYYENEYQNSPLFTSNIPIQIQSSPTKFSAVSTVPMPPSSSFKEPIIQPTTTESKIPEFKVVDYPSLIGQNNSQPTNQFSSLTTSSTNQNSSFTLPPFHSFSKGSSSVDPSLTSAYF